MSRLSGLLLLSMAGCFIAPALSDPVRDAGADVGLSDAGVHPDAGQPQRDSGVPNADVGPSDSGVQPDAGQAQPDSGGPRPDAGPLCPCTVTQRCVWGDDGEATCVERLGDTPGVGDLPRFFSKSCMVTLIGECNANPPTCGEAGGHCVTFRCQQNNDCPWSGTCTDNQCSDGSLCVRFEGPCRDTDDCRAEPGVPVDCHPEPEIKGELAAELGGICAATSSDLLSGKIGYRPSRDNDLCFRPACGGDADCGKYAEDLGIAFGAKLFPICVANFAENGRASCDVRDCISNEDCARQYLISNAVCSGDAEQPGWCYVLDNGQRHYINGQVLKRTVDGARVGRSGLPGCSHEWNGDGSACEPGQLCSFAFGNNRLESNCANGADNGGCPAGSVPIGEQTGPCMYRCGDPNPSCLNTEQQLCEVEPHHNLRVCVERHGPDQGGCEQGCPDGQQCQDGHCINAGGCPGGCPNGEVCQNDQCVDPGRCQQDQDCANGQVCRDGACVDGQGQPPNVPWAPCASDTDCARGERCETLWINELLMELGQEYRCVPVGCTPQPWGRCPLPLHCAADPEEPNDSLCRGIQTCVNDNSCSNGQLCDTGFVDGQVGQGFCVAHYQNGCPQDFQRSPVGWCFRPLSNNFSGTACLAVGQTAVVSGFCSDP